MYISHKLKNIWENYNDYILLSILIIIVSIITYYRVLIQIDIGPLSDSCDFFSNAYVFAGHQGYFDATRPLFFSFLAFFNLQNRIHIYKYYLYFRRFDVYHWSYWDVFPFKNYVLTHFKAF